MSIAEAINNAQNKVKAAYTTCKDKGAKLPDVQDLANLPATIDSVKSGGIEVVQAYYVDTEVTPGKKVLVSKVTNPIYTNEEFCNGMIPFVICDGIAYGVYLDSIGSGSSAWLRYSQIIDGQISSRVGLESTLTVNAYGNYPYIYHFCNRGKNGVPIRYNTSWQTLTISNACSGGGTSNEIGSSDRTSRVYLLEHGVITWSSSIFRWKFDVWETTRENMTSLTEVAVGSYSGYQGCIFERAGDSDSACYCFKSNVRSDTTFENPLLYKYNYSDGTVETVLTPYYEFTPSLKLRSRSLIQTKDYKYLLYNDGYIFLEYKDDINSLDSTGIVTREFPQQILDAIGDRTVLSLQTFYDNYFSLSLSDGTTLMCNYTFSNLTWDQKQIVDSNGGDLMKVVEVEIVQPFKVPDSDTVWLRAFSEDRLFWFLSMQGNTSMTLSMNPAGQFEPNTLETNYFAFEPSAIRFNNTVLTGFLTGNYDIIEGKKIVDVKTATKGTTLIDYSDVVNCYTSGVALGQPKLNSTGTELEPNSVCDVDVLLTKVGYQATGSDTFSPEVRVSFISENGFAGNVVSDFYPIYLRDSIPQKYDITNGSVDSTGSIVSVGSDKSGNRILPLFFHNGQIFGEMGGINSEGYMLPGAIVPVILYTPNKFIRLLDSNQFYGLSGFCSLETSIWASGASTLYTFDTDLNALINSISLSGKLGTSFVYFVEKSSDLFYAYYPTSSDFKSWKLVKINKTDNDYAVTDLKAFTYSEKPQNIFETRSMGLAIQHKDIIQTETGYRLYLLTQLGYTVFDINTEDETLSSVEFHDWGMLSSDMGDRTIYKIQTFYDGTFSLDLSEGTTLICGFSDESGSPEVQEIVEPFIIEGDSNVYHRTFTETKLYWYQRPEGTSTSYLVELSAPISSNPYGPYNATKATVNWLAVPRTESRWNNTVLTGVIRQSAQLAKPVFDDTGRRVLQVETTIKKNICKDSATYEWTLEDYDKVNE